MNQWSLLFVAPLLAYASPWTAGAGFSALYLLVPLAALVGGRYVFTGVFAIALGGLAFVVHVGGTWGTVGGNPGLYLVALAVAAMAASQHPLASRPLWPSDARMAGWLAFSAPFLLTLELGTGYMQLPQSGLWFAFRFPLEVLGCFVLFAMGARGVRPRWPLAGLVAAGVLTWGLATLGAFEHPPAAFFALVTPLSPAAVVAALAAYTAGGTLSALLHGGATPAFWRRPALAVAALLLLWFLPELATALEGGLAGIEGIGRVAALLPLAALMAGLLGGARGVVLVSAAVSALLLLWISAGWYLPEAFDRANRDARLPLEAPFVAAAWSVLGARLAQARAGAERFRLPRYPAYVVLFAAGALAIFGAGSPLRLAAAGLFVVAGLAIYFAGERLGRAMAGTPWKITPERWVSFTALVLLAASVAANWTLIVVTLRMYYYRFPILHAINDPIDAARVRNFLGASISPELAALLVAFAAVCGMALLSALASLLSSIPKLLRDSRRIAAFAARQHRDSRT